MFWGASRDPVVKLPKGSIFGCPCVKDLLSCWVDFKLLMVRETGNADLDEYWKRYCFLGKFVFRRCISIV